MYNLPKWATKRPEYKQRYWDTIDRMYDTTGEYLIGIPGDYVAKQFKVITKYIKIVLFFLRDVWLACVIIIEISLIPFIFVIKETFEIIAIPINYIKKFINKLINRTNAWNNTFNMHDKLFLNKPTKTIKEKFINRHKES